MPSSATLIHSCAVSFLSWISLELELLEELLSAEVEDEDAALKFSRSELTSSVFDFSSVGLRITSAPAVMMLPVERMHFVFIFFLLDLL